MFELPVMQKILLRLKTSGEPVRRPLASNSRFKNNLFSPEDDGSCQIADKVRQIRHNRRVKSLIFAFCSFCHLVVLPNVFAQAQPGPVAGETARANDSALPAYILEIKVEGQISNLKLPPSHTVRSNGSIVLTPRVGTNGEVIYEGTGERQFATEPGAQCGSLATSSGIEYVRVNGSIASPMKAVLEIAPDNSKLSTAFSGKTTIKTCLCPKPCITSLEWVEAATLR